MSDAPKTTAEMWSEWLREASVLIAVFGGLIDPLFEPKADAPPWLRWAPSVDSATGRISSGAWFVGMLVLAVVFQLVGMRIEKGRK